MTDRILTPLELAEEVLFNRRAKLFVVAESRRLAEQDRHRRAENRINDRLAADLKKATELFEKAKKKALL